MTGRSTSSDVLDGDDHDVRLLAGWRAATNDPSDESVAAVRARVLSADASQVSAASDGRRRVVTRRRVAVAAAVAAFALVLPAAAGHFWPTGGATAEAAGLLTSAADSAITSTDATLAPGQWLRIRTEGHYPFTSVDASGKVTHGWQDPQIATFWVPYDATGDWYLHRTDYGTKTPDVVAKQGAFYDKLGGGSWQVPTAAWLAALPRDPGDLRKRLMHDAGHSNGEAVVCVADLLRSGVVPADVRASLYRVLATIKGVEVVEHQVTLDGETGVAFGRQDKVDGELQQIVIDPATGRFIGERYVGPDGKLSGTASTTYKVVDQVPAAVLDAAQRTYWSP